MQAIMEPIFEIPYLIGVVLLGILTIRRAKGAAQYKLFGIMAIVLGCGDAFHLVPRMWALISSGNTSGAQFAAALGFGKLVTSVTMTIFYVMLYHVWLMRYKLPKGGSTTTLSVAVYALAATRIALCLMPQNDWLGQNAPLNWGIYRNIPFAIMGLIIIIIYYKKAHKTKDKAFNFMWLAVTLSFLFYIPVVLFADAYPLIGMLMIPKTCAYVWIVVMGFNSAKKQQA